MTTFLVLGGAGIVLVVLSLLLGDVLEGVLHLDALDNDLFSVSTLAAFIGSLGFGGAIGLALSGSLPIALATGLVVGLVAAFGALRLTRALMSAQVDEPGVTCMRSLARRGRPLRHWLSRSRMSAMSKSRTWLSMVMRQ